VIERATSVTEADEAHYARAIHATRAFGPAASDTPAVVGDSPLAVALAEVLLASGVPEVWRLTNALVSGERAGLTIEPLPLTSGELAALQSRIGEVGPDVVFECDGEAQMRRVAIELARPAGRIVLLVESGAPTELDPNLLVFRDKRVQGTRQETPDDRVRARELVASGRLGPARQPGDLR
jgi:threonine dehydrogenase-like Zn-dependent dehydrogenase